MQVVQKLERSESTLTLILGPGAFSWRRVTDVSRDATEGGPSQLKEGNMLRTIVVAIGVSIMVVGGVLPANADDEDKGAKKQHQAILNAVKSDTDSDTAAHAAQSADHAALSHKVDEVRTAIGNISTGGSAGGDHSGLPPTWDKVLSADNPAHIDMLVNQSRLTISDLNAALLTLEMRDLVRALPGKCFVRKM